MGERHEWPSAILRTATTPTAARCAAAAVPTPPGFLPKAAVAPAEGRLGAVSIESLQAATAHRVIAGTANILSVSFIEYAS
jgi:hypothetical protein